MAFGIFSGGMHAGSSSPTRDRTQGPCNGSAESYPLGHQGSPLLYFFFFPPINLFIYLAALGLRCCERAFSSCGEQGLLVVAVLGLLTAVASLAGEHGL